MCVSVREREVKTPTYQPPKKTVRPQGRQLDGQTDKRTDRQRGEGADGGGKTGLTLEADTEEARLPVTHMYSSRRAVKSRQEIQQQPQ